MIPEQLWKRHAGQGMGEGAQSVRVLAGHTSLPSVFTNPGAAAFLYPKSPAPLPSPEAEVIRQKVLPAPDPIFSLSGDQPHSEATLGPTLSHLISVSSGVVENEYSS